MATLRSNLELSVIDRVSAPARRIEQNLENLRQQERRNREMFNHHRNALAGTAAAAFVLAQAVKVPIEAALDFERKLVNIQQQAQLTGAELEKLGDDIRAGGLETGIGASAYGDAVEGLMVSGLDAATAETAANPLSRTALAYEVSVEDMVAATAALLDNLGIAESELEGAYDSMAVGGKAGKFELKDMAGEFPAITAAARALGMQGEEALASLVSWLQIARMGTSSGSEAATNMANFMQKVLAPDAVKKFAEEGIDIVAELNRAVEAGADPIEHAVGIINGITGGDRAKLGELFADTQVLNFLLQATEQLEEYRRIRDEAMDSEGTVDKDYALRMESSGGVLARFEASVENLNIAIGNSLLPKLTEFIESITPMVDSVARFVDANEELVAAVVQITAALIGLKLLSHAGGMAAAFFGMGKGGGGGLFGLGGGGRPGAGSGTGAGGGKGGWSIPGANILGALNAIAIGSDVSNFSAAIEEDGGKQWLENRAANDAKLNAMLADLAIGSFKPFEAYQAAVDAIHAPSEGGIGGGYTGPTIEQIDALKAEIAKLDAEIAEWPEEALEERRARLVAKLADMQAEAEAAGIGMGDGLHSGLAAQLPALDAEMQAAMNRLRIIAAGGINIPVSLAGPQLSPGMSRMIDAPPGAVAPPGAPRVGAGGGGSQTTTITNTFGPTIVQTPTNANPTQISRAMGEEVGKRVRAAHYNGGR